MKLQSIIFSIFILAGILGSKNTLASGSIDVKESVQVNAKPAAVWALIGDYNGLYRWHPVVASSQRSDKIRILTLGNGAQLVESLLSQDDTQHSYSYAIVSSPLPVTGYESTIKVTDNGKGGSTVTWSSSFNAAGVSDEDAASAIQGVYQAGLNNLEKLYN